MSQRHLHILAATLVALALAGCESTEQKRRPAPVPVQATAPTMVPAPAPPPPTPASKPAIVQAPQTDPVIALVDEVERQYQAGQAAYAAGHLEAAKDAFNRAFDRLLQSPIGVHNDPRLEKEFEKLVAGVHGLEMQALKQGDGFTEQKTEPAPIDEANDVTFPVDPNLRAKAEVELKQTHSDLPLVLNDEVASYIAYFSTTRGHYTLEHALTRAGRYRDMILRVLREEGVPQDLIYLAQAESGFQPLALSRAGARGMWQFIASRGVAYGLRHDWWVDGRQDPEASTRAAARHLKDLYNQFGDWYLAMAAYNSGPGTVQAAVQRTGYADFWELYRRRVLPKETKNYVPIILAVTIMAKNPAQYGLTDIQPEPPMMYDTVSINYPVDLRLVAECVDASLSTLLELNPSLLRMTTPKEGTFELRLPMGSREKYVSTIESIPSDMRVWWRFHKVGEGDTLASVAKKYNTTTKAIADVNNLDLSVAELPRDTKLIIPVAAGRLAEGQGVKYSSRVVRYRVRQGDTVLSVADEWGVPPDMVRKWNKLRGNDLRRGRTLIIHRPQTDTAQVSGSSKASASSRKSKKTGKVQSTSAGSTQKHTVRSGETLSSIASHYGTTVAALRKDNAGLGDRIKPGDVLRVPASR